MGVLDILISDVGETLFSKVLKKIDVERAEVEVEVSGWVENCTGGEVAVSSVVI